MRTVTKCFLLLLMSALPLLTIAQDSTMKNLPPDYLDKVSSKATAVGQKLDNKTDKALWKMAKQEARMRRKLSRIDSLKAKEIFDNAGEQYKKLEQRLQNGVAKPYIPSLDTLGTSLKFLQANAQWISQTKNAQQKLKDALSKVHGLENRFQKAEEVKKFLQERKQYLKDQLARFGFGKEIKKLNKHVYYYNEQINEYKSLLKDHKKAEKKAIELLSRTKLFKDFMQKNGMLASLFPMPGNPDDPSGQFSMVGLQTRAQVNNLIQQQIASGGPNAQAQFRQNLQDAQSKMNELKNKVNLLGNKNGAGNMPEGFKPNNQKTKSFFQRLEYGTNLQTQKANHLFPATSDIGLSLGYKLSDRSIIGIGASYKMGWGEGWNNIRFSHEGVGLRSFIDWKIKGSFWISGGYEQNYKAAFRDFSQLKDYSAWQQSGLVGLSKVVSLKAKFFKQTKLQLLWDFMSYQQVPRTQAIVFRVGYSFK